MPDINVFSRAGAVKCCEIILMLLRHEGALE
jgi:hypothetical protein